MRILNSEMGCGVPFSPLRRNYVFLRLEHLDHHSVADDVTLEYGCAVLYGDSRVEFGYGFVGSDAGNLHLAGDRIARLHRGLEAPIHL